MSVKTRLARLEKMSGSDDGPGVELMADVDQFERFDAWLASQGFADDPHAALSAGLKTPAAFQLTLEQAARVHEDVAAWHWFVAWRYITEKRRRLDDPRFVFSREHDREMLDDLAEEAKQRRAKLEGWGIGLEDALMMARRIVCESGGNTMPAEECNRITAAIREDETERHLNKIGRN